MHTLMPTLAAILMVTGAVAGPMDKGDVKRCTDCGTVRIIEPDRGAGETHGGGAIIGAVIGGFAGNEVEKHRDQDVFYKVTVAMDVGGGLHTVNVHDLDGLAVNDKVRVSGDNLKRPGEARALSPAGGRTADARP